MTTLTAPLRLADDVEIVPVADLDTQWRTSLADEGGRHAVSRPGARMRSVVIDDDARLLLGCFRNPTRLTDAVSALACASGLDATEVLDQALPLVVGLLRDGALVADGDAPGPLLALELGDVVVGATVDRVAHVMDDTLVARADIGGQPVALKIARRAGDERLGSLFDREATALAELAGGPVPTLLARGDHEGHDVLVMDWVDGDPLSRRLRVDLAVDPDRAIRVARDVVQAFATIHEQGVLHGDVHPGNVLVGEDATVTVVDFGMASDVREPQSRGGVPAYHEPEAAAMILGGGGLVPPTARGEQHAVATMVVEALLGRHPVDLPLDAVGTAQAIVDHDPAVVELPAEVADWARPLAVARARDPRDRHDHLRDLAVALGRADVDRAGSESAPGSSRSRHPDLDPAWIDDVLDELGVTDPSRIDDPAQGPRASVFYGAAGVGLGLLALAEALGRPDLLDAARVWAHRAVLAPPDTLDAVGEFFPDLPPDDGSTYHGRAGAHAVLGLVALARDEVGVAADSALQALGHDGGDHLDPMMGPASRLRFATDLHRRLADRGVGHRVAPGPTTAAPADDDVGAQQRLALQVVHDEVAVAGAALAERVAALAATRPPIGDDHGASLGAAHGWAGVLDAQLRAVDAGFATVTEPVVERLDQLAAMAHDTADGPMWNPLVTTAPRQLAPSSSGGWCNGEAGFVATWLLAWRTSGDEAHLERALAVGMRIDSLPSPVPNLCCGAAGKALALLRLHRATGDDQWRRRASRHVAEAIALTGVDTPLAADLARVPLSLWKGRLGVAVALGAVLAGPAAPPLI